MARFATLTDEDLEQLLDGRAPAGLQDLAPVAQVAAALRARTSTYAAPLMSDGLREQIGRQTSVPARHVKGARRRLLRLATVAVVVLTVSLAASANALPAPVQRIVSEAGELVGLDVPLPDETDAPGDDSPDGGSGQQPGEGTSSTTPGSDSEGPAGKGPPETTPGGATPADPGTPGDYEPATPATPPEHTSGGGNGNGQLNANGSGNSQGQGDGNADGLDKADM